LETIKLVHFTAEDGAAVSGRLYTRNPTKNNGAAVIICTWCRYLRMSTNGELSYLREYNVSQFLRTNEVYGNWNLIIGIWQAMAGLANGKSTDIWEGQESFDKSDGANS